MMILLVLTGGNAWPCTAPTNSELCEPNLSIPVAWNPAEFCHLCFWYYSSIWNSHTASPQCFPHSLSHFGLGLSSIARDVVELTIGQPQISPGANLSTQTSGAIRVTWKILISWSLMFWFKKKAKIRTMYKAIYFLRFRVCLKIYYTLPSSVKKKDILHYLASHYLFPLNWSLNLWQNHHFLSIADYIRVQGHCKYVFSLTLP